MDVQAKLLEKIKQFEDVKKQLGKISEQIGGLTEQQRAIYNQGLEIKGAIDALVAIQEEENKKLAGSETAKLTLPVGVKPVVAAEATPAAPVADVVPAAPEAAKPATVLEVR